MGRVPTLPSLALARLRSFFRTTTTQRRLAVTEARFFELRLPDFLGFVRGEMLLTILLKFFVYEFQHV